MQSNNKSLNNSMDENMFSDLPQEKGLVSEQYKINVPMLIKNKKKINP